MKPKYLLDTNILLRASDRSSPSYSLALHSVATILSYGSECVITPQVLVEYWVVATSPIEVNGFGWSAEKVNKEINHLISQFSLVEESPQVFINWLNLVSTYKIIGKRVHDIRLLSVMQSNGITHLLTFNISDFINIPGLTIVHLTEIIKKGI